MAEYSIAFLINSFIRGGAERVLSIILPELQKRYKVYLILINGDRIEFEYEGDIIKLGGMEKKNRILYLYDQIKAKRKLEKVVNLNKIDCVISLLSVPNILNILGKSDCKKIISVHSYGETEGKRNLTNIFKEKVCLLLFRKADMVIGVSNKISQKMIEDYHVNKEKAVTIVNPYDIDYINSAMEKRIEEKIEAFYNKHLVIVSMGRLTKGKGFIYQLESLKFLLNSQKDLGLVIIGGGEERDNIEKKIKELNLQNNVLLIGMKDNPFPYIKNAELYIHTSLFEGFPNALVEAMACGKPVIACDCLSGPREILYEKYNLNETATEIEMADYGILIPDFTSRNGISIEEKELLLSRAIEILLKDKELQCYYGGKAKERAREFSIERCVQKYKMVIDRVIEQKDISE